jgi:hypothetical protein
MAGVGSPLGRGLRRRKRPAIPCLPLGAGRPGRPGDPPPADLHRLALVAAFDRADPAAWPDLDAAIRAELDECAGVLGAPGRPFSQSAGQNWSRALTGLDRKQDCCTWVERLTDRSETADIKLEGVRMSSAAMRAWRAAPARVTPALPVLGRLESIVASRHRIGINLGSEDTEIRADETLLAAVVAARRQIVGRSPDEARPAAALASQAA